MLDRRLTHTPLLYLRVTEAAFHPGLKLPNFMSP